MIEVLPRDLSPLLKNQWTYPLNKIFYSTKKKMGNFVRKIHAHSNELEREQYLLEKFQESFKEQTPLFYQIQIETCSFCNEKCSFCPANIKDDIRGKNFMSEEIFQKIISQLKELEFKGLISLFNNNEPLIDKRIEKFVRIAKTDLPECRIEIISNGSLINIDRYNALFDAGLDSLVFDNYYQDENNPKFIRSIEKLIAVEKDSPWSQKVRVPVFMRYQKEILSSRAGNAPNKKQDIPKASLKRFCPYPFMQFNVNYEGKVTLCCNDVYYQSVLGDINQAHIKDIWEKKLYQDIRKQMLNMDRNQGICTNCDATNNLLGPLNIVNNQVLLPEYINGGRTN